MSFLNENYAVCSLPLIFDSVESWKKFTSHKIMIISQDFLISL